MALSGLTANPQMGASGVESEDPNDADEQAPEERDPKEEALVKKLAKAYDQAREFDAPFRKQIASDRRYAAGTSDLKWAVTTNLIGAFIDILVSLLYARDPDVSVRKSPQVDESGTSPMEPFARTLEIVISRLWKDGKLKQAARKGVRSVLSNSEGWLKCTLISEKEPQPEVETALNDARETHERLEAQIKLIEDPEGKDPETLQSELDEKKALVADLENKIEIAVAKMFVVDYVSTENMQVSPDVTSIADHLDANWNGNEIYVEEEDALSRFERLTKKDLESAKKYYQKAPKDLTTGDGSVATSPDRLNADNAGAFTTSSGTQDQPAFLRVIEVWDRRDKMVRTYIEGVKAWAKEPFQPAYPTKRFYPYFYFAFYEVDGERHAQSLSWRLYKLQDEYSATRSNFRLTRERSIPGVLFNAAQLDETEAKKLSDAKHQEYTPLKPADPDTPLANLFASKPVANIDMRVFDPSLILSDMERISGVQEALSAAINSPGNPKTATEANIQQSGTNARTGADRDALEGMLTDLAQYTAEQAIQCLSIRDVQRMAGPKAFWPQGMSLEDLFTLVQVQITAGTTGKPRQGQDSQAWSTLLPLIKQTLLEVEGALAKGNMPMANALIELVKETMLRLGDESDVERFIPRQPPPGTPGAQAPPPPVVPTVSVSLKGEISPAAAAALINPALKLDGALPPPNPAPGAAPAPGNSPIASPAAPAPGAGPVPLPHP